MSSPTDSVALPAFRPFLPIPAYGVWVITAETWMVDRNGTVFHTGSLAVAEAQAVVSNRMRGGPGDYEARMM